LFGCSIQVRCPPTGTPVRGSTPAVSGTIAKPQRPRCRLEVQSRRFSNVLAMSA
jgi:hypothetical protein